MNIIEILSLLKPEPNINQYQNITYSLEKFYRDMEYVLDINWEMFSKHPEFNNIHLYRLHHWSVDDHEGGIEVFTYKGIPFGTWESKHEDTQDHNVLDFYLSRHVVSILLECLEPIKERDPSYYVNKNHFLLDKDYPIVQSFPASYSVQGNNLLYIDANDKFHLVEKYSKTTDGGYFTKYFDIVVESKELTVSYESLLGVVGDSKVVAEGIVSGSINIGNLVFCGNGIIPLRGIII